jgi:peptidoglycan/xylan/chitin deacetylase (PgdA/CDA1 family)
VLRSRGRDRLVVLAGGVAAAAILVAVVIALFGGGGDGRSGAGRAGGAGRSLGHALGRGAAPRGAAGRRVRARVAEDRAIRRVLRYTPYITRGGKRRKVVALTFDDGPGPQTPELMRELRHLRAPATFFQVAQMIHVYPQVARREREQGFAIGGHTISHPDLATLRPGAQRREIGGGTQAIEQTSRFYPRLFRPPYGAYDDATLRELRRRGMLMVLWTVSTRDYDQPGVGAIVKTAVKGARPGAIILMHDAGGATRTETLRAVPRIVRGLRRRGFKLVTVPRMLLVSPPRGKPARPPSPYPG